MTECPLVALDSVGGYETSIPPKMLAYEVFSNLPYSLRVVDDLLPEQAGFCGIAQELSIHWKGCRSAARGL